MVLPSSYPYYPVFDIATCELSLVARSSFVYTLGTYLHVNQLNQLRQSNASNLFKKTRNEVLRHIVKVQSALIYVCLGKVHMQI